MASGCRMVPGRTAVNVYHSIQLTGNSVSLAGEFAVLSQLALRGYDEVRLGARCQAGLFIGHAIGPTDLRSHRSNDLSNQGAATDPRAPIQRRPWRRSRNDG